MFTYLESIWSQVGWGARQVSVALLSYLFLSGCGRSWEFRVFNRSDKYRLELAVSADGVTQTVYQSDSEVRLELWTSSNNTNYYFIATTFSAGTVKFFRIKSSSTQVKSYNASRTGNFGPFMGSMDEVWISQVIRNIGTKSYLSAVKSTQFTAD